MKKSPDAFRTISEVSEWLKTPAHVLRFWESRFSQVKPVKRAGGRRYYRPTDMQLLGGIKKLLHEDGLTIRGTQKILREKGVKYVASLSQPLGTEADVVDETAVDSREVAEAPMAVDVVPSDDNNVVPLNAPETAPKEPSAQPQPEPPEAPPAVAEARTGPASPAVAPEPPEPEGREQPEAAEMAAPEAETEPQLDLGEPGRPAPLGADLPQQDPPDDGLPSEPATTALLRLRPARERLRDTDRDTLSDIVARLKALAGRMDSGGH